jgi:hypothetical protein
MKRASRAVRIGLTPYGRGVFARRRFRPREIIVEIRGVVIDDPRYGSPYCMDLGDEHVLEPYGRLRFLNHSCRPSCDLQVAAYWDESAESVRPPIYLQSLGAIEREEQLTIDFAWPACHAIPCLCGDADCRGWIVAQDELDEVLRNQDVHTQQNVHTPIRKPLEPTDD